MTNNLGMSFSSISDEYDKNRIDYPEELIDFIISKIKDKSNILEIGAGTGIASEMFAKKGFSLSLVEPSKNLLDIAKKKLQSYKMAYFNDSFENVNLPENSFDLVFSAQAFHWIDPDIGFQKVYDLMKNDGYFTVFWNVYHNDGSKLLREVKALYDNHCPDFNMGRAAEIIESLRASDLFRNSEKKQYQREVVIGKSRYFEMVKTYSWVASLSPEKKELFVEELDDILSKYEEKIKVPYETLMGIVQK